MLDRVKIEIISWKNKAPNVRINPRSHTGIPYILTITL